MVDLQAFEMAPPLYEKKHVQTFSGKLLPRKKKGCRKKWPPKSCLDVASKVGPGDPRSSKRQVADESKAKNGKTASKVVGLRVGGKLLVSEKSMEGQNGETFGNSGQDGVTTLQPIDFSIYQPKDI